MKIEDLRGDVTLFDVYPGECFSVNDQYVYMKIDGPYDEVNVVNLCSGESRWMSSDTPVQKLDCKLVIE